MNKQYTTEQIQQLLDGVTEGEWIVKRLYNHIDVYTLGEDGSKRIYTNDEMYADMAFIRNAPAIVRQLLEEIERLKNEAIDNEQFVDDGWMEQLKEEIEWRDKKIERLKAEFEKMGKELEWQGR